MHKYWKILRVVGTGVAFALTPMITVAQDQGGAALAPESAQQAADPTMSMAPEQGAETQVWPADKQSAFKQWPANTQSYFWTLTKERQTMFWVLSDSEKVSISTMKELQRESVWAQIESRIKPLQS